MMGVGGWHKSPASHSTANNPTNCSACSSKKAVTDVQVLGCDRSFMLNTLPRAASPRRGCCTSVDDSPGPRRAHAASGRALTTNTAAIGLKDRSVNTEAPAPTALNALSVGRVLSLCARLPLGKHCIPEMEGQGALAR